MESPKIISNSILNYRRNIRKSKASVIFKSFIKNADIIRKAEANNRPLIEYDPSDSNLKKQQETHQLEWENLVTEILERIK